MPNGDTFTVSREPLDKAPRTVDMANVPDSHGLSSDSMRGSEHFIDQPVFKVENGQPVEQPREDLSYHQITALLAVDRAPEDDPRTVLKANESGRDFINPGMQAPPLSAGNNAQVRELSAKVDQLTALLERSLGADKYNTPTSDFPHAKVDPPPDDDVAKSSEDADYADYLAWKRDRDTAAKPGTLGTTSTPPTPVVDAPAGTTVDPPANTTHVDPAPAMEYGEQ